MEVRLSPAQLRDSRYTGIAYDGHRTSLPYSVWIQGFIQRFCQFYYEAEVWLAQHN